MASNKSLEQSRAVIKLLMDRYPHLFDLKPELMVPLWSGITGEIIKDLKIHPDHHNDIKRAICYYQSWNGYLMNLAFSKVKYGLWKEVKQKNTSAERSHAREMLIKRNLWSPKAEDGFKGRQLHKDID